MACLDSGRLLTQVFETSLPATRLQLREDPSATEGGPLRNLKHVAGEVALDEHVAHTLLDILRL